MFYFTPWEEAFLWCVGEDEGRGRPEGQRQGLTCSLLSVSLLFKRRGQVMASQGVDKSRHS